MRRIVAALLSLLFLAITPAVAAGESSAPRPPSRMAAMGDSITQAFDVCCWYGNHPSNSWSTGGASWDGITSHYERLRSLNPNIAGHNYNDSVSGAKMADGPAQARAAVTQQAKYVTILLGANDLCTSSPSTMTPVDVFRGEFRQTLGILDAGLTARPHVLVASIPDVYQLWNLYHTNSTAELVWDVADICQSLLGASRTEDERQLVRERNMMFNAVLQQECAAYAWCRFDQDAVFDYQFGRSDVSKLDYFHPSLSGQANLATITWQHSWWY
jgi:lysophospholipase L1-like esterase